MPTASTALSNGTVFNNGVDRIQWTLAAGEAGEPSNTPTFSDRSVQFSGVFGGATVTLEGTVNGTDYLPLTDPQGNAITKTGPAMEAVTENVWSVRPNVSGGDGTTQIVVTLISRRGNL